MASDPSNDTAGDSSASGSTTPQWGRVLICGGTDWPKLGRKERGGKTESDISSDLLEPHILRSLSNVKVSSIHTSCSGCHFIVLDVDGVAWMFGRNAPAALGVPKTDAISENEPRRLQASDLGASEETRFVHAACGRTHSLLVDSEGRVWTAGSNNYGQCGHPVCAEIPTFKQMPAPTFNGDKEHVVKAAAGVSFSVLLTKSGKVFAFGSGEKGQLGNGRTGEHIATGNKTAYDIIYEPVLVKGLEDKTITQVVCGQQHSLALDSEAFVHVWGYNGYCRLGLGNQQDVLIPKVVPQFAGPNEITMGAHIIAGPSSSAVVDKQGMYWMAGKWKNSGEGSSGSPYSSFRYMQDIMTCKVTHASSGGVTHFALAAEDDGSTMTIAWGQNAANGELGLGPDQPKSATKPMRHQPLVGIDVFSVAAGQNTTLFLAKPNEKFSDLPRHPVDVEAPDECVVCGVDNGNDESVLACDKCDFPYHLQCLEPPLDAVPEGEWFCPKCEDDASALGASTKKEKSMKPGQKRKAPGSPEGASKRKK